MDYKNHFDLDRQITPSWDSFEQNADAVKGLSRGKLKVAVVSTAKSCPYEGTRRWHS